MTSESPTGSPMSDHSPTVRLENLAVPSSPSAADIEHNYFALPQSSKRSRQDSGREPPPVTDSSVGKTTAEPVTAATSTLPDLIALDHCYCKPHWPEEVPEPSVPSKQAATPTKRPAEEPVKTVKTSPVSSRTPTKTKRGSLSDVTNVTINRELSSILTNVVPPPRPRFERREYGAELVNLFKFLITGADAEDIEFLRRRYERLLQVDSADTDWLNEIHWVEHPVTSIADPSLAPPPRKRRKHGSADDEVSHHVTGEESSRSGDRQLIT